MLEKILVVAFCLGILYVVLKPNALINDTVEITPTSIPTPTIYKMSASSLFDWVNNWRAKNGYSTFVKSEVLCDLARKRLPEITRSFSHEGVYKYWAEMNYVNAGENLAKGYYTDGDLLDAWLKSPSHKANLVKSYKYSCIEIENEYIVQEFATF